MQRSLEYQKYYQKKLEEGLQFQDFVTMKLYELGLPLVIYSSRKYQIEQGESRTGIEIKLDNKLDETGNLYIEYEEKSNPSNKNYVPSGIDRSDNSIFYAIGNYKVIYLFSKKWLKQMRYAKYVRNVCTSTSRGYTLPKIYAEKYAITTIKC